MSALPVHLLLSFISWTCIYALHVKEYFKLCKYDDTFSKVLYFSPAWNPPPLLNTSVPNLAQKFRTKRMARLDCHAKIWACSPTEVHIHLLNSNLKGTLSRLCQLLFEKGEILGGGRADYWSNSTNTKEAGHKTRRPVFIWTWRV